MTAPSRAAAATSPLTRPAGRAVAIGAGVLAVLGLAIGQAAAKSDVSVTAVLLPAPGAAMVRQIDVTGHGADDAARYQRLCLDRRLGRGGWRRLDCAPVGFGAGGTVQVDVPLDGSRPQSFRAALFRVRSAGGDHPVLDRISRTVTVSADGTIEVAGSGTSKLAALVNRLLADRSRLR